jgi:hypothetical protein
MSLCELLIEALAQYLPVKDFAGQGVEFGRGSDEIADGVC